MERALIQIRKWLCLYPYSREWSLIQIDLLSNKNLSLQTICRTLNKYNKSYEIYEISIDDINQIPNKFLGIYQNKIFLMNRNKKGINFNNKTHTIESIYPIILVNPHTQLKKNILTITFLFLGFSFFIGITLPYIKNSFQLIFLISILFGFFITWLFRFDLCQ